VTALNQAELAATFNRDVTLIKKLIREAALPPINLEAAVEAEKLGKRIHKTYDAEKVKDLLDRHFSRKIGGSALKEEIDRQKIRKLQIENDLKENKLIPRELVGAEIRKLAGGMHGVRIKAEQEWPRLFAEAGDDIGRNATVLRALFDDLFRGVQALALLPELNPQEETKTEDPT
jgi:hypothetical protein